MKAKRNEVERPTGNHQWGKFTPKLFLQKMAPQASSGQQMFFLSSVVPAKARLGHALPGKKVKGKKGRTAC